MPKDENRQVQLRTEKLSEIPSSVQFDLFSHFYGDQDKFSNTIEFWDAVPKFSCTARRQSRARDEKGRLEVYEYRFFVKDRSCLVEIQPARVKMPDGTFKDFLPSTNEELVEEVLRKIFTDQQFGHHDVAQIESWVSFTLQMVRKELKKRGKTRNIDEIKHSIDILSSSILTVYLEGEKKPLCRTPILNEVYRVSREEYLEDGRVMWAAKLPALISKSVNELEYRQFNYDALMQFKTQLARWVHKRLSHNFTQASYLDNYRIKLSTIERDSGLLEYSRINDKVRAFEDALGELQEVNTLSHWEKEEQRGGRNKLIDAKYTLYPDMNFITDVKAANKRAADAREKLGKRPGSRLRGSRST